MADDQSPEGSRRENVADWTNVAQGMGAPPSKVERVADLVNRSNDPIEPRGNETPQEHAVQRDAEQHANDMWTEDELEYQHQLDNQKYEDPTTPSDFEQPSDTPAERADANPTGLPGPANPAEDEGGSWWGGDDTNQETPMSEEGGSWYTDDTNDVYADAQQAMEQARDPIGAGIDAIGEATQNVYDGVSDAVQNAYDSFGDSADSMGESGGESFSGDDGGW
jgi:hypothetical protein